MGEMSEENCPLKHLTLENCGVTSDQIQTEFIPMLQKNKSL